MPFPSDSGVLMETPPAAPGFGAETLLALAAAEASSVEEKAKRVRKRSRYLNDYETPILDGLQDYGDHADGVVTPAPAPRKGEEEEAALLLRRLQEANVAAADLLAALHRSAASPCGPPEGVDADALLGFFALHRASVSVAATGCGKDTIISMGHHRSKDDSAATDFGLNPCQAMSVSNGSAGKEQANAIAMGHAAYAEAHHNGPANAAAVGGAGPSKRKKKKVTFALGAPSATGCGKGTVISTDHHRSKDDAAAAAAAYGLNPCRAMTVTHRSAGKEQADAIAMGHTAYAEARHNGTPNAAALGEAGPSKRRNKKVTFALGAPSAAGASCSAQPPTHGVGASSSPKKAKEKNKAGNSPSQGQHSGKPVALILQFAQGTADQPPSKEELHSTFRGFGPLIEPDTEVTRKQARIVFQSGAAAEAAYSCAHTLGVFAAARLQYLRPPQPAPKIPLMDVRKNLEKMIASLTGPTLLGKDNTWNLAGEMQHLLAKVDKALGAGPGPSTSAAVHYH